MFDGDFVTQSSLSFLQRGYSEYAEGRPRLAFDRQVRLSFEPRATPRNNQSNTALAAASGKLPPSSPTTRRSRVPYTLPKLAARAPATPHRRATSRCSPTASEWARERSCKQAPQKKTSENQAQA